MKGVGFRDADTRELTRLDLEIPEIGPGEVLVRIAAFGVGTHDRWFLPATPIYPYVIGIEGAGVVERVGADGAAHPVGARVMFVSSQQPRGGTWAEYAAVAAGALIPIPDALGFAEAAALPVAGGMAIQGIDALDLQPGETVLIAGASGAIGTLAIQLAVARGARVAVTASPANHELTRALGAEVAFDYRDPDWTGAVRAWAPGGVAGAMAIPHGSAANSLAAIRDGGRLVTISGDQVVPVRDIAVQQAPHRPDTPQKLAQLARDAAEGRLVVVIEKTYPLDGAIAALEKTETGHASGKSVVVLG